MHCPTCGQEIAPANEAAMEIAGQLTIEEIRENVHPEVGDDVRSPAGEPGWRKKDFSKNGDKK